MELGDLVTNAVHDLALSAAACYDRGDVAGAVQGFRQAACMAGRPPLRDRRLTANLKLKLAIICTACGRRDMARRLLGEATRTLSTMRGVERDLGLALNALGVLEQGGGRPVEAARAFAAAIHLMEAHGSSTDEDDLPRAWRNLGIAQSALDVPRRAARSLLRALSLPASPPEREMACFSLANAFSSMGRYRWAVGLYEKLLREVDGTLRTQLLGSLAILREHVGELETARSLYGQAVQDARQAVRHHKADGEMLARIPLNAATFHASLGDHAAAERLLCTAQRWVRGGGGTADVLLLNSSAGLALERGDATSALRDYQQAAVLAASTSSPGSSTTLAMRVCAADLVWVKDQEAAYAEVSAALDACRAEQSDPHAAAARAMLGMMAFELSRRGEAWTQARASLLEAPAMGMPELRWRILLLLARLHAAEGRQRAAILLGKLAVISVCRLSAAYAAANGSGHAYRRQRSPAFHILADWLAVLGRVPEACQVHQAGLADELFEHMRRGRRDRLAESAIGFTAAEEALACRFERAMGFQDRDADSQALGAPLARGRAAMAAWLDEVAAEGWASPEAIRRAANKGDPNPGQAEPGVAVLRYLQYAAGYRLVVQVGRQLHRFDLTPTLEELGRLCKALRVEMLEPGSQVSEMLSRLHDHLVAPAAAVLEGIRELRVVPDGVVRYVPFAALHDGNQFLVERHALSMPTATAQRGRRLARREWQATGFGYRGLAHARQEVEASMGRLRGRVLLDEEFTRDALLASMRGPGALLHVASHFTVEQARAGRSRLTLGDGSAMLLDEFRAPGLDLSHVELLVLSACDTGLEVVDEQGLSSLAGMFQHLGVRSVLATLWPVDDAAAAELTARFYAAAFEPGCQASLSEALRSAQLGLLGAARSGGAHRGGLGVATASRVAHPYFWAGYALFGDPS